MNYSFSEDNHNHDQSLFINTICNYLTYF